MKFRSTHTCVELGVPKPIYNHIAQKLKEASYGHAFGQGGMIDMTGIAVVVDESASLHDWHVSTDGTRVVSDSAEFMPLLKEDGSDWCPRGTTVILLGQGGVTAKGVWDGKTDWWVGWYPLPKVPKGMLPASPSFPDPDKFRERDE